MISIDILGPPGHFFRDFQVQKSLNFLRCQPMMVLGFTMIMAPSQFFQYGDKKIQNNRSVNEFRVVCWNDGISVTAAESQIKDGFEDKPSPKMVIFNIG